MRVQHAAIQLQTYLTQVFGKRISAVITPPVDHIQAYTIRELIVRIEHGANIAEAKRRIKEAITHILSIPSNKNVKIITDVDC